MKSLICCLLLVFLSFNLDAFCQCDCGCEVTDFNDATTESYALSQSELSPLDILILDIRDVKNLIEEGNNKLAITILKSANKEVRKVKEFNAKTKKITSQRIKKGIVLLKQGKNDEALDLIQTAIDALVEAGLAEESDFESV